MLASQLVLPSQCRPWNIQRARSPLLVLAGLKKETKKLTKAIKGHRKRLEALLEVQRHHGDGPVPVPAASQAPAGAPLSQAQLHAVLGELAQLQTSLAAVRQQQRRLAAMREAQADTCGGDGSSSDSDCEEDDATACAPSLQLASQAPAAAGMQAQEQQRVGTAVVEPRTARSAVVAAASSGSVCLEPPVQEADLWQQQLPPPRPSVAKGRVLVCQGKACMRKGGLQVLQAASHATAASPGVEVLPCKCLGKCKQAPAMRVRGEDQPRSSLLTQVAPQDVPGMLEQLLS